MQTLVFPAGYLYVTMPSDDVDPVLPGAVFMCSVERCDHTILCVEINYALKSADLPDTTMHRSDADGQKSAGKCTT